uniref:thymidylate synthase n=1 Tax=viral metagenome TaxID=1070528 RepID=A0A6C0C257_9ZZZZ
MLHQEKQYLELIKRVINNKICTGRNGNVKSLFGVQMRYSLDNNIIPILTTKKMPWKVCLKELLWFINGDTNNGNLQKQNVKIWNGNATRDFLDSRGLYHLKENDLGPIYGHQWRFYNAKYSNCNVDYTNMGIDQLQNSIELLKNDPYSRRNIITAWNPEQLDEMALPPCHILMQFHVSNEKKLSCSLYQRSADIALGVPFNIASYAFLTHMLADICDLEAHEFIYNIGDAHIYEEHLGELKHQVSRTPYPFPTLQLNKRTNIDDYIVSDFFIKDYKYHPSIKMEMII